MAHNPVRRGYEDSRIAAQPDTSEHWGSGNRFVMSRAWREQRAGALACPGLSHGPFLIFLGYMDTLVHFGGFSLCTLTQISVDSYLTRNYRYLTRNCRTGT